MALLKHTITCIGKMLTELTRSFQGWFVLGGILLYLCYLPLWIRLGVKGIVEGGTEPIINLGLLFLGGKLLAQQWGDVQSFRSQWLERLIGSALIVAGVAIFWSRSFSISSQAGAVILATIGCALAYWGFRFFQNYGKAGLFVLLSIYPSWSYIVIRVCRFFTSPDMLEQIMAWLGSIGLTLIGLPSTASGAYLHMASGSVLVAPGCSGFDMAYALGSIGLLWGEFQGLRFWQSVKISLIGIAIALIANIPRVMLLAIASIKWGQASFDFWHGPIGGQIFASVMFTIYYYALMVAIPKPNEQTSVIIAEPTQEAMDLQEARSRH